MADFCRQCTIEMFGPEWADRNDMQGLCPPPDDVQGYIVDVLCEHCGPTSVDHTGECIYHNDRATGCWAGRSQDENSGGNPNEP